MAWFIPRRLRAALFQSFNTLQNATRVGWQAIRARQAAIREHAARQPNHNMPATPKKLSSSPKRRIEEVDAFPDHNQRPLKRRSPSPPKGEVAFSGRPSLIGKKRSSDLSAEVDNERLFKRRSPSPDDTDFKETVLKIYREHGSYGVLKYQMPQRKVQPAPLTRSLEVIDLVASMTSHIDFRPQEEQEEERLRERQENMRRTREEERLREQEELREARRLKEEKLAAIKAAKAEKKKRLNAKARQLEREASEKSLQERLAAYHAWLETVTDRLDGINLREKKDTKEDVVIEEKEVPPELVKPSFLPALPDEWEQKVVEALAIKADNRILGKSMDGVEFSRKDIGRLLPRGEMIVGQEPWLNDEVVNAWYANLCARLNEKAGYVKGPTTVPKFVAYNSQWLKTATDKGINGIATWSRRKGIKNDKLLQAERIFFPVNTGAHWTLLTISPADKSIEYLDSLNPHGFENKRFTNLARQWLKMELGAKYKDDEWSVFETMSSQQNNCNDCGVFACLNGLALARGYRDPSMEFGADDIPVARRVFVANLLNGGFTGIFDF